MGGLRKKLRNRGLLVPYLPLCAGWFIPYCYEELRSVHTQSPTLDVRLRGEGRIAWGGEKEIDDGMEAEVIAHCRGRYRADEMEWDWLLALTEGQEQSFLFLD